MMCSEALQEREGPVVVDALFETVVNYARLARCTVFPGKVTILATVVEFISCGWSRHEDLALELSAWCINELLAPNSTSVDQSGELVLEVIRLLREHNV